MFILRTAVDKPMEIFLGEFIERYIDYANGNEKYDICDV